ncbi:MAG: DNA-3-methyladenine glycosylase I, partial [bacterium]
KKAFDDFNALKIADYDKRKFQELLADPGIVRNKLKINATIQNASAYLEIQKELGTFDAYIWQFVDGTPKQNAWRTLNELPAKTPDSEAMSKDLLQRGFKFVGPTICYAFMQAVGMVNDHVVDCFRYAEVS